MKRTRKFLTLAVISALLCGCGQTEPAGTANNAETSAELTVTTTEIAVTEEITTTTEVTTTPETTAAEEEKTDEQRRLEQLIAETAKEQGEHQDSYVLQNQIFGDFDGDGTEELAAVYGNRSEALLDDLCHGTVWYASGDKAESFFSEWDWLAPTLVTSQGKTFIKMEQCAVSDSCSHYLIINNSTAEVFPTPIVQGLYPDGEYGDFTGLHSTYDASIDIFPDEKPLGTGHTYKPYWFYLENGQLEEYFGEEITSEEFLSYNGAENVLKKAEENGGADITILKRGNGTITVSYRIYGESGTSYRNRNIVLKYRGAEVFEETEDEGAYLPNAFSDKTKMTAYERLMMTLYDNADAELEDKVEQRWYDSENNQLYAVYNGSLWLVDDSGAKLLGDGAAPEENFPQYIKENYRQKPAETTTATTTTIVTTTAETTTSATTAATTTVVTTTPEATTTPKTKKTKKTKKTTTTPEETTTPETTEVTTTTEAPEIIPESGIYTAKDGTLYVDGNAYEMTFEDEFEGDSLDFTKWEYCPEWQRQNVNCYWRNSAVSLDGQGKLCITTSYESGNYIAGGIRSKGKFEQAYGYFEVKCTLNTIPGYWSAFWLLCEEVMNENNSGVDGTEIDIMESAFFDTSQVNHALNWDGYGAAQKAVWYQTQKDGLYEGYHTFSLLWTEEEYVFYVDGAESYRTRAEEAGGVSTAPSYLKFTTETGLWTIDSLDNSKLPDNVYVDYIRVYSKSE